ncbi:unnamed protein product [Rotaria socialis]|nr:unnamed protein product [Rotaria socialis]CAF3321253.1 unnamed protein product [Rotaria socialis]CAF3375277.1 unnamed protein product [Rotaria socialis]CAF3574041.1 unnamed protein product [Rotaria socialis]CAF3764207.1 unnamed protein product [Rotaria socialis]
MNIERPIWNEAFDFNNIWPSNEYFYINVYDENEGKKPDLIGSKQVSLDDVIEKGDFDGWVKLPGFVGFGSHDHVHISMHFEKISTG